MRMARAYRRGLIRSIPLYWPLHRWLTTFKGIHHDN